MSQNHQFKFISHKGREGTAPLDIVYPRILKNLDISIISNLKYLIQSSISDEVFDSFIKFLNLESIPEINTKNVTEYSTLSQELKFRDLEMLVEKFIKEKKECDEVIQQLISTEKRENTALLENLIASHLDYYIENHPDLLSSLKLTTLYNIFNSNQRVLHDEGKALLFLMNIIEKGKHDFAILLPSINGENIDQILIQKVINSDFFNTVNFTPNIKNQAIKNFYHFIDETKSSQEKLASELNAEIKQVVTNLTSVIDEKVNKINQRLDDRFNELNQRIDDLERKVESATQKCKKCDTKIQKISKDIDLIKKVCEFNGFVIDNFNITDDLSFSVNKNKMISQSLPFSSEEKERKEGILSLLKKMEKTIDDHQFIVKLSSRDPYNLLLSTSNDFYCSSATGNFFIQIEFESEKTIKGIILRSHNTNYIKGFKIFADETEVYSTNGIEKLKVNYGEAKIQFNSCKCRKIKLQQNGLNYSNKNYIRLQRFDVITDDAPDGYFKSIINDYEDVHFFPVKMKFNTFSTNDFFMIDATNDVSSMFENGTQGYLEIQFITGFAFIEGYRLKRNQFSDQMKAWEILGQQKDDDEWLKLDWRIEDSSFKYPICEVFEMKVKTFVKRIRIIQTQKTWDDKSIFRFEQFDVFGKYYFLE